MKIKWLVLWGFVATVLFLVVQLPASLVWGYAKPKVPHVSFETIDGSVWEAQATGVQLDKLELEGLSFSFNPLKLLFAQLSGDFTVSQRESLLAFQLGQSFSKTTVKEITGEASVLDIVDLVSQYQSIFLPIPVNGMVDVDVDLIELDDKFQPKIIEGQLQVSGLALGGQKITGSYLLKVATKDDLISGKLKSLPGAEVSLIGDIVLTADGRYQIKATVTANELTSDAILSLLRMVGIQKNKPRIFQFSGQLPQRL